MDGAADRAGDSAKEAARSTAAEWVGRVGIVARGLVYGIAGVLSLVVAAHGLGSSSGQGEQAAGSPTGAIREIADAGWGRVVLLVLAVGFVCYALWRLADAVGGRRDDGFWQTVASSFLALMYVFLAWTAAKAALTGSSGSSGSEKSQSLSASLMGGVPLGRWIVALIGVVIIGVGVGIVVYVLKRGWLDAWQQAPRRVRLAAQPLGYAGYISRALAYMGVGGLFIAAAVTFDPEKAKGLDGTLQQLTRQPYGPWLLLGFALGLFCYMAYSWLEGAYAET